jgi:alkylresorcinol/alkylpyrone synthase
MTRPPRLASIATALPEHVIRQSEVKQFAEALFGPTLASGDRRLMAVFDSTGIATRHSVMPLDWFREPHSFGEVNELYIDRALDLASHAVQRALDDAGLEPRDVDHLLMVSSTGIATPSLDARLANRMGFRGDFKRTPVWGLGCAGGAAGLSRARDFALADPRARVVLVALELCSLTFQHGDMTRQNLVAASLFSDGAAAAVVLGAEAGSPHEPARLELIASQSTLWPDTLDVMGWNVDGTGLHVLFSRDIPSIVRQWVRPNLEVFLERESLAFSELRHVVAHPGGPKVIAAYAEALGLPLERFRHATDVLRECGNMSAPTCLFVLERFVASGEIGPGEHGVLAALGPGFSSELVLLRGCG